MTYKDYFSELDARRSSATDAGAGNEPCLNAGGEPGLDVVTELNLDQAYESDVSYDYPEGIELLAAGACPPGYEDDGSGSCVYAEKLSGRVQGALASVVESIAKGEKAGGAILNASAAVIDSLTGPAYGSGLMEDILDATSELAKTIAKLECVLTKKLCCSLSSLCDCGQPTFGPTCCVLGAGVENALGDIVSSIGFQEDAAGQLILSGANTLDFVNKDEFAPAGLPQYVLNSLNDLAASSADVVSTLETKLCLSLEALTGCSPTIPDSVRKALEDVVESVAVSELGASTLVTTGAATLTGSATSTDIAVVQSTIATVQDLTSSALKIEEATMRKLCLTLGVLCGDDIASQLDCSLSTTDCSTLC